MKRKLVALILVVSVIFCMFTGCASNHETTENVEVSDSKITVLETDNTREAFTTVEGVPLKCEHILDSDEYWLYLADTPYQLDVKVYDNWVEVCMLDEISPVDYEGKVVGQAVLTATLAVPAFITAAKVLIATAAGVATTTTIYVSANALGNVIGGVRSSSKTYYRYRTVDIPAANAIRFGRMNKYNTYYEAYLSGNTVMVGREINRWSAVRRLESGYDVFATSEFAAIYACIEATTNNNRGKVNLPHSSKGEGYYPHYHALGRRWVNNPMSAPHCWYPYA